MYYNYTHVNLAVVFLAPQKINRSYSIHHLKFFQDFPGGPAIETSCSQCRELGFNPWSGN